MWWAILSLMTTFMPTESLSRNQTYSSPDELNQPPPPPPPKKKKKKCGLTMQERQEKIDVLHCTVHQGQIYTAGLGQAGLGPLALSWERVELEGLGWVDHTLISPLSQLGSLQLCWRWSVLNPHFCWSGFWWGQAILFFTTILSSIKTWRNFLLFFKPN